MPLYHQGHVVLCAGLARGLGYGPSLHVSMLESKHAKNVAGDGEVDCHVTVCLHGNGASRCFCVTRSCAVLQFRSPQFWAQLMIDPLMWRGGVGLRKCFVRRNLMVRSCCCAFFCVFPVFGRARLRSQIPWANIAKTFSNIGTHDQPVMTQNCKPVDLQSQVFRWKKLGLRRWQVMQMRFRGQDKNTPGRASERVL